MVKLIAVGKTKEGWIKLGINHYQKLLKKYLKLELIEIREEKITKLECAPHILNAEAKRILKHIEKSTLCIALDIKGECLDSFGFARLFEENINRGHSQFMFILGGALGLSQKILNLCSIKLSLSPLTFTHQMSKLILLEQIYRAFSILKGTEYHK